MGFFDDVVDFFSDAGDAISDGFDSALGGIEDAINAIGDFFSNFDDIISNVFQTILENTIYKWMYYLMAGLCKIVGYLDEMYKVFSGQEMVKYDGKPVYLLNLFFENHTVSNVYWGIALLGIVLAFGAAMVAVARKMFDSRDKDPRSLGQILGSLGKSILLIVSMNAIMLVVLTLSNRLLEQINYVFDYAEVLDQKQTIDFTEEQYAAMGRVLNTIGNYSLSDSSNSMYNINSCFNEIRPDLNYLSKQGVFDFFYVTRNDKGVVIDTWQSVLQNIAHSANLSMDAKMDVYNEDIASSIKYAMHVLQTNQNLRPISHYEREYVIKTSSPVPLDRYVFLLGTLDAAKNSEYNKNPELTDGLRGPYYFGDKTIYEYDVVRHDFSFAFDSYDYLIVLVTVIGLIWNLAIIIFNCATRIFLMLFLYIVGPLIFAIEPWDDGEKRKQWTSAFIIQAFGVLGTVIAMRLLIMFIPIVMSSRLVLFDGAFMNFLGKTVLVVAGIIVSRKASGILTGILANNGAQSSIHATESARREAWMGTVRTVKKIKGELTKTATKVATGGKGGGGKGG